MLEIQGDISVGEMQALYEALDRSGVQIEDFKVDANKGIIGLVNGKTHCFNGGMKVRK